MEQLRILVFDDPRYTARAHYRNMNPLTRLAKESGKAQVDGPWPFPDCKANHPEAHGPRFMASDWVYASQVFSQEQFKTLQTAKEFGCKVWIDYDDAYWAVSKWTNKAYQHVNAQATKPWVDAAMKLADVVTFSTDFLYETQGKGFEHKCHVINNAYDDYRLPDINNNLPPSFPGIYWRGSHTHGGDLYTVAPQIVQLSHTLDIPWRFHCEYGVLFFGDHLNHKTVEVKRQTPEGEEVVQADRSDIIGSTFITEYMKQLQALRPLLTIVPLADNDFNRGKSNIAWIETVAAGSVVIAPDLPEFDQPGVLTYSNPKAFKTIIERATSGKIDLVKQNSLSRAAIAQDYLLSQTNKIRAEILGI